MLGHSNGSFRFINDEATDCETILITELWSELWDTVITELWSQSELWSELWSELSQLLAQLCWASIHLWNSWPPEAFVLALYFAQHAPRHIFSHGSFISLSKIPLPDDLSFPSIMPITPFSYHEICFFMAYINFWIYLNYLFMCWNISCMRAGLCLFCLWILYPESGIQKTCNM